MARKRLTDEELLNLLDNEAFSKYYHTHNMKDICKYFDIGTAYYHRLVRLLNLQKTDKEIIAIRQKNCLETHGVTHVNKLAKNKKKLSASMQDRGSASWETYLSKFEDKDVAIASRQQKISTTKQERYGDSKYNNREKFHSTCLERYGTENYFGSEDCIIKARESLLKRYGVDSPAKSPVIKAKMEATCLEHYGVKNNFASKDPKLNGKATMIARYGVDQPLKLREFMSKMSRNMHQIASDGTPLDSRYELLVYEFFLKAKLNPYRNFVIDYGENKRTFIDFKINDLLIEVKGAHLLKGIWNDMTTPMTEKLPIYESNNVVIITDGLAKDYIGACQGISIDCFKEVEDAELYWSKLLNLLVCGKKFITVTDIK